MKAKFNKNILGAIGIKIKLHYNIPMPLKWFKKYKIPSVLNAFSIEKKLCLKLSLNENIACIHFN